MANFFGLLDSPATPPTDKRNCALCALTGLVRFTKGFKEIQGSNPRPLEPREKHNSYLTERTNNVVVTVR